MDEDSDERWISSDSAETQETDTASNIASRPTSNIILAEYRQQIQSSQMRIHRDFALLTTATWSCRAPTLTDSVGAVFCVRTEPVQQAESGR